MTLKTDHNYIEASREELQFIRGLKLHGLVSMISKRTGKSRAQILYQLNQNPVIQDQEIINSAREIVYVVTGQKFNSHEG